MTVAEEILRRLDLLESRAAIAELSSSYCVACDDRDMVRLRSLFTDDVRIGSMDGAMRANGAEETMAMFNRMFAIRGPSYHWTHDRFVEFDASDPNRATGMVLAHAETTPNAETCIAAIRYQDEYRRVSGRWLFSARLLSFLYYMPVTQFAEGLKDTLRIRVHGKPQAADYPEQLPSWIAYAAQSKVTV